MNCFAINHMPVKSLQFVQVSTDPPLVKGFAASDWAIYDNIHSRYKSSMKKFIAATVNLAQCTTSTTKDAKLITNSRFCGPVTTRQKDQQFQIGWCITWDLRIGGHRKHFCRPPSAQALSWKSDIWEYRYRRHIYVNHHWRHTVSIQWA